MTPLERYLTLYEELDELQIFHNEDDEEVEEAQRAVRDAWECLSSEERREAEQLVAKEETRSYG